MGTWGCGDAQARQSHAGDGAPRQACDGAAAGGVVQRLRRGDLGSAGAQQLFRELRPRPAARHCGDPRRGKHRALRRLPAPRESAKSSRAARADQRGALVRRGESRGRLRRRPVAAPASDLRSRCARGVGWDLDGDDEARLPGRAFVAGRGHGGGGAVGGNHGRARRHHTARPRRGARRRRVLEPGPGSRIRQSVQPCRGRFHKPANASFREAEVSAI